MKKMMAKMVEIGGLALVFAAACLSDSGTAFAPVLFTVVLGLLTALAGNFAGWKCDHPSRKTASVRFRPHGAPALCGTPAPLVSKSTAGMRKAI